MARDEDQLSNCRSIEDQCIIIEDSASFSIRLRPPKWTTISLPSLPPVWGKKRTISTLDMHYTMNAIEEIARPSIKGSLGLILILCLSSLLSYCQRKRERGKEIREAIGMSSLSLSLVSIADDRMQRMASLVCPINEHKSNIMSRAEAPDSDDVFALWGTATSSSRTSVGKAVWVVV